MIYYLAQLDALCKKEPVKPKVIIVPSLQVGYHITTALASAGRAWANLHLTTAIDWARHRIAPRFRADGWTPLLHNYDLFFIGELVENTLEAQQASYFSNTNARADLSRAFLRTFQELRLAGVTVDNIRSDGKDAKIEELKACYAAYTEYLQTNKYYDDAAIYEGAIADLEVSEGPDDATYAIFDETLLGSLATQYVGLLGGAKLWRIGRPQYSRPLPDQSAAARFIDAPLVETNDTLAVGAGGGLLLGIEGPDRDSVRVMQVLGAEEEVRFIFRDVLAQKYSLDGVEIAYTTDRPYLSLIQEFAERYDVPIAYASGLPPEKTRPGQALMGLLRWIMTGFDAAEFIGLCQARLIHFSQVEIAEGSRVPYAFEVATLLKLGRVRRGRVDYHDGLKRLDYELVQQRRDNETHGKANDRLDAQLDLLAPTRMIIDGLFELVPTGPSVKLRELTNACSKFLTQYAAVEGDYDREAVVGLTLHLKNIGDYVEISGPPIELAGHLLELVTQHRVEAGSAQPGRVFAVPLERAGYTHRPNLYILGMDEGSFPGRGIEDPVLLDDERTRLDLDLPLHRPRPGERVWQAERVLGMTPGKATLLARRRSLESGSEYYPAALFQQLEKNLKTQMETPRSFLPASPYEALDQQELMLISRHCIGFKRAMEQASPCLMRGREARLGRLGATLTRFDGRLNQKTPQLNPANGKILLSVSRLESLVKCPYQYFLKYVLHIDAPEEDEEDATTWLNPLDFGSMLHDLLCDFMQQLHVCGEKPDRKHLPAMKAMVTEKAERQREKTPVTHEAAYRADVGRLEQAAEIFLNVEAGQENTQPIGFEVSFGLGQDGELDTREPVLVKLAQSIELKLRGRIDRVDKVEDGYAIWDYKSGSAYSYREASLQHVGSYLQWALYAYVLDEILKREESDRKVVRSGYFFTTEREYGRRIAPVLPPRHEVGDKLRPLFDLVSEGCFYHIQKEDHCKFCEYSRVCAEERIDTKAWDVMQERGGGQGATEEKVGEWING